MMGFIFNMKILIVFLSVFLFAELGVVSAQDISTINVGNIRTKNIAEITEIYCDSTNKSDILDLVLKSEKYQFTNNDDKEIHIPFTQNTYWIKFTLINNTVRTQNFLLQIKNPTINEIQLFVHKNNMIKIYKKTGDAFPFYDRLIKQRTFVFPVQLHTGVPTTCYIKINSHGDALNLPIKLFSHIEYAKTDSTEKFIYGFFYGIVFIIILVNFCFLLVLKLKRKTFIYYILYVLFLGFFNLTFDGLSFRYLWAESPNLNEYMLLISPLFSMFFLAKFSVEYLELELYRHFKKIKKLITYYQHFILLLIVLLFLPLSYVHKALSTHFISLFTIIIVIFLGILIIKKSPKIAIIFLMSFSMLVFGSIILSTNVVTGWFDFPIRDYSLKIGFVLQLIILSTAVIYKVRLSQDKLYDASLLSLKKLNEFKEKANKELEEKVKKRTQELTHINERMVDANDQLLIVNKHLEQQKEELAAQRDEIEEKNTKLSKAYNEIETKNNELEQQKEEINTYNDKIEIQKDLLQKKQLILQDAFKKLEIKKDQLQKRNRDITDSINYAQRIQHSIMPGDDLIKKLIPNSFILFKPKDVLSGDFYWVDQYPPKSYLELVQTDKPEYTIIAAIDCTGHGVPGALLSIVGYNLINHIINELHIIKPGDILYEMNKSILKLLKRYQQADNIQDGMDMSIITIENATKQIQFAGAKNPLYYFTNNEFIEIKGSRYSIGGKDVESFEKIYETHQIIAQKGDCFYLFSDGFADQFGGKRNKKFKQHRFKKALQETYKSPMNEQADFLEKTLHAWMGNTEQVDDILVIGIRI